MAALGMFVMWVGICLVLCWAVASYYNEMLFPYQIMEKWGQPGISVIIHGAMWSDLIILPRLAQYVVENFGEQWDMNGLAWSALAGFCIALGNQLLLMFTQAKPDPMGWKGEWWSITIALHFIYMWGIAGILWQFCFFTPAADQNTIAIVALVIAFHMTVGIHIPLGLADLWGQWKSVPKDLLNTQPLLMLAGIWVAVTACTIYAGGWKTGTVVGLVGLAVLATTFTFLSLGSQHRDWRSQN